MCIICFVIYGYGYNQNLDTIDTSESKSILEKDSKEEEQIRDVFFNNEVFEDNKALFESSSSSRVTEIEAADIEDIYKRLRELKENVQQLQLEQKNIKAMLFLQEKAFAINSLPQYSSNPIDISSEFPINSEFVEALEGTARNKVVVTKMVSQEDAERALEEAKQAMKNKLKLSDSNLNLEYESVSDAKKVRADFNGDGNSFFAHICTVNQSDMSTTICFENSNYAPLVIPNTIGGNLTSLSLKGSNRDYLLYTEYDNELYEYYLFVLRNNTWNQVIDSFCIHESNLSSVIAPIRVDPNHSDQLLHYYSVFDLDAANVDKHPWKLEEESVKKIAW